jgi:hypothetical protein
MKKISVLIFLLGIVVSANAQNIIQITQNNSGNNTTKTHEHCGFKINGICSCEDIGGVSLEKISREALDEGYFSNGITTAYLKNYNNFTVTVLMKLLFDTSTKVRNSIEVEEVYQVVIPANETKGIELRHCNCPSCYSLQGMIVRRLRN